MDFKIRSEFLEVFNEFFPKLYRFCLLRVDSKELAEDLTSETFLKTWQYLKKGGLVKSYPVFLYQVARNLIIDHWRSKKRGIVPLDENIADSLVDFSQLPEEISRNMELKTVIESMNNLEEEQRQLLHWRFVDSLSIKEIAELSGKKPNAVYVSIYRAVKKLKSFYA